FITIGIRYGQQHAAKARTSHLVFGREICSTEKRFAIRQQEAGERPSALAGNGADRGLISRIDVGTLVAVYFHRDKVLVDDFGDFGVFGTLAVNNVAPVAPDGADVEKNGFVFGLGARESGIAPFMPVNRLMGGGAKIGACGILQAVGGMVSQNC